ncbi:MAG: cellulose biosynthesis protein BcsQ [Desulfobulbaceae bacterium]|nr:cellulose biosynthesis protein BcsQ [Desulfobulbaceae bacterium]
MNIIAVTGISGGVGVTTVTAHLTATLAASKRSAIAFDFSAGNTLRLHFAMNWHDKAGLAPQVLADKPWQHAAYRSAGNIDFVPLGEVEGRDTSTSFDAWAEKRPGWFSTMLDEIDIPANSLIICDCSRLGNRLASDILSTATLALIVLAPDAIAYANAKKAKQVTLSAGAKEASFVINGFNPGRLLDQDVTRLMLTDFRTSLAPVNIHQDESVREALATMQTVFDYAPSCQAAFDFTALGTWMVSRLAHLRENAS